MISLTRRQFDLLKFLHAYTAEHGGVSPRFTEMASAIDIKSKGHVSDMLDALVERGAIRRLPHRARAIEVIAPDEIFQTQTAAGRSVTLNPEILASVEAYAKQESIELNTAVNELLRQVTAAGVAA